MMCWSCAEAAMRDADGGRVAITREMALCASYIAAFYELPHMSSGGPLHIVTDDNNVEDHNLDFCLAGVDEPRWWSWADVGIDVAPLFARLLALEILSLLRQMTEVERHVVCAGWPEARDGAPYIPQQGIWRAALDGERYYEVYLDDNGHNYRERAPR